MRNVPRSNILKMLQDEAAEDRKINTFPAPYKIDCTPYHKTDFSEVVYRKCLVENKTVASTLLKLSKVVIVGDVSVGKTCIVNRFCRKLFDSNYKSTIGVDFEVERFDILNIPYNLQIWDTAGQERFKSIAQSYYRGSDVIIVVFDFNNIESLCSCETWLNEALTASAYNYPFIFLVGAKMDLLKKYALKNFELSALKIAKKLNAEYWAVSSKTGKNISNLFYRIAVLAFEKSIKNEVQLKERVEIGTNLIPLKKEMEKKSCEGFKCR